MAKTRAVETQETQSDPRTAEQVLKDNFKIELAKVRAQEQEGVGAVAMDAAIQAVGEKLGRYPKYVSIKADVDPQTGNILGEVKTRIVAPAHPRKVAA